MNRYAAIREDWLVDTGLGELNIEFISLGMVIGSFGNHFAIEGMLRANKYHLRPVKNIFLLLPENAQLRNSTLFSYFEPYIKILLRLYSGLFDDFVNINEEIIATKMKTIKDKIKDILYKLQELEIVQYQPKKNITQITYLQNRVENEYLSISSKKLKKKKINELKRVNYILDYCNQKRMCRSKILLEYFGEKENENCGKCDICRNNKMINLKKL